ncbi:hypothetical protein [Streptomyces roseolilacinus]|uniref:Uncharacterized protein n=1 Tax=Streptomyces roseolilacinus TaxID=66904 RepID=A0A918AW38_9ACTN|nr:hypothetical protein [Streptomyces roseolilacinus]GGP92748.1 hypothetical protein GCM10010249_08560 [Streptomyces roseolilacinus]
MTPESPTEAEATARELRTAFADAAHDVTPAPVPLAAIERAGRTRRRRRTTALATCCALTVTAMTLALVHALAPAGPPSVATPPSPVRPPTPSPSASPSAKPPRIVAPGERVDVGGGRKVWLTEDGKRWADSEGFENFRSVVDGNVDRSRPGVSHQSEGDRNAVFHSGLYYGTEDAARIELTDATGRKTTATLLELPGEPDWGVWYATTPPGRSDGGGGGERLALYDAAGRLLAEHPPL